MIIPMKILHFKHHLRPIEASFQGDDSQHSTHTFEWTNVRDHINPKTHTRCNDYWCVNINFVSGWPYQNLSFVPPWSTLISKGSQFPNLIQNQNVVDKTRDKKWKQHSQLPDSGRWRWLFNDRRQFLNRSIFLSHQLRYLRYKHFGEFWKKLRSVFGGKSAAWSLPFFEFFWRWVTLNLEEKKFVFLNKLIISLHVFVVTFISFHNFCLASNFKHTTTWKTVLIIIVNNFKPNILKKRQKERSK